MKTFSTIIAALLVLLGIINFLTRNKRTFAPSNEIPPYFKKQSLLNGKEQLLFQRLKTTLPDYHVMTQVRLADIVEVRKHKNWQYWFNKVSQKSVDFVICDEFFKILVCIELDGQTHLQPARLKADKEKNDALNTAKIPLIRIPAHKLPEHAEIEPMIKAALSLNFPFC
jgi:very-short-patch-repair endonuclease